MLLKAYTVLLGLYPAEFRAAFGAEMAAVFEQALAQSGERGRWWLARFALKEMAELIAGAARERCLHVAERTCEDLPFPSDVAEVERYLDAAGRRMVHAMAHHDFAGARHYDLQDRKARAPLVQLRAQPN